jgi:O-antigen/teichoic acid export membrane protein
VVALLLGPVLVIWQGGLQSLPGATMAWALALVPLIALGNLRGAALRGLKRVVEGQLPEYLLRPAILLLLVVGSSLLVCWQASPPAAMALHALASLTAFLLGAWMLWRHTPPAVRSAEPAAKSGGWLASSLIFALLAGFGVFNRQVSTAALGVFQPPDQVGVYRVAVQMATLASFGLQAVRQVAAPRFAGLHARGRVKRLRVLAVSGARVALSFSLLLALGLVLVGRPFLKAVFGPEFEASYWPLLILLVGQVVSSAFGPVGYLLNMAGYEKETVRVMAAVVVLNALLNLVLIPVWGTMAAAVATAASTCTSYLLLWRRARRVLGINSLAFGRTKTQAQVGATG